MDPDFELCATLLAAGIAELAKTMSPQPKEGEYPCLLISDIPMHIEKPMWGAYSHGVYSNDTSVEWLAQRTALEILGVTKTQPWGRCRKLDELETRFKENDIAINSMIDKGLAFRADRLWTCQNGSCNGCARGNSHFSKELSAIREKVPDKRKKTFTHWPSAKPTRLAT
jgi:hypothetical protein